MGEEIHTIKDSVKRLIEKGDLAMKPKWYFVLKSILNILSIAIVFSALLYFTAFMILVTREQLGPEFFKLGALLHGMPWLIVLFSVVLLFVLELLVRKYSFVYQKPIAYTLFALILFVMVFSVLIHKVDRKDHFPRFGEKNRIFIPMHRYYRKEFNYVPQRNPLPPPPPILLFEFER